MTELLEKAFAQASKLSTREQDALAVWILDEMASEIRWRDALVDSADALALLADEALVEHREGVTGLSATEAARVSRCPPPAS